MKKLKLISVGVFDYTLHLTLKTQKSLNFSFTSKFDFGWNSRFKTKEWIEAKTKRS